MSMYTSTMFAWTKNTIISPFVLLALFYALWWSWLWHPPLYRSEQLKPIRVAIVGGGFSGVATAFSLQEAYSGNLSLLTMDLYESSKIIGGRKQQAFCFV